MSEELKLPCKKHFRQRAHSNPLGDHSVEYPIHPDLMDWAKHFPKYFSPLGSGTARQVRTRILRPFFMWMVLYFPSLQLDGVTATSTGAMA